MNLIIMAIVAAVLYGAGFATGWKIDSWRNGAAQAEVLKEAQDAAEQAQVDAANARAERDRIANNFETKLAGLRIVNRTINNEVRHEVEKTVYGDPNCNVPDSGVRLRYQAVNTANGTGAATGKPDAAVPGDSKSGPGKVDVPRGAIPSGPRSDLPIRGMRPEAPKTDRLDQGAHDALAALNLGN